MAQTLQPRSFPYSADRCWRSDVSKKSARIIAKLFGHKSSCIKASCHGGLGNQQICLQDLACEAEGHSVLLDSFQDKVLCCPKSPIGKPKSHAVFSNSSRDKVFVLAEAHTGKLKRKTILLNSFRH
mmetsp:Transcript_59748/g.112711  ORF Transcript_59748/g.112711 Transcript_59748/m.112711 type:complete len:126 (+) Transcript_59748:105-482(+)